MSKSNADPKETSEFQLVYAFAHRGDSFNSVAWSPDGKHIASGSSGNTVRVWETATGKLLRTFEGHRDRVNSVSWSSDGKQIASGSNDNTVRVWDAGTGKLLSTIEGHGNWVLSVAWSQDGKLIASGSSDKLVRVWEAATGTPLSTLEGHWDWVNDVEWSADGKKVATGSSDVVRVWEAATGKLLRTLEGHKSYVNSVAWSRDGKQIASGSGDGTVRVWDAATGRRLRILEGHEGSVKSVAWSPDGKQIASASSDWTVRLWHVGTGKPVRTLEGHEHTVSSVAWSWDGKHVASGSSEAVRVWEALTGKPLKTLEGHLDLVTSVAWSGDGKQIASGSGDKLVRVWEAASGKLLRSLEGHEHTVSSVAWMGDGNQIASGSNDNTVRIWEAGTGKLLRTLEGHVSWVSNVAWSGDGKQIASGSNDNTLRVWDAATGALLRTMGEEHGSYVTGVAWSWDGKQIASGSNDKTVRIWQGASGKRLGILEGHAQGVTTVAWSGDGSRIASGSNDKTVRIWEAATGKLLRTLEGHENSVKRVAWSGDGKQVASGSDDDTVRVWDTTTGECVWVHRSPHTSYFFVDLAFRRVSAIATMLGRTRLGGPDILTGVLSSDASRKTGPGKSTRIVSSKVVLVGESGVGKSGLTLRLAEDRFEEQVSTHGMRLWSIPPERLSPDTAAPPGETREIVLWDLGGQDDYRLVHQLFLHDTTVALMLLDPTRDGHFEDIDEWNLRLESRLRGAKAAKILVGARADQINRDLVDGARVAALLRKWEMKGFCITSAKNDADKGVGELRRLIADSIDWDGLSRTSRPRLFQRIREIVGELRGKREVLVLYSDLERRVREAEPDEFSRGALDTVVEQLARQGAITDTRLSTGDRALILQIGHVEAYAGSLILIARENARLRGAPAVELSEAIFRKSFPGIKDSDRLPPLQERAVIECVIELLIENGICLKRERLLIFPALFPAAAREGDESIKQTVSLFYDFSGAIDNIYSALVAELALSERFGRVRLWKDRAEFERPGQGVCGLQRIDRPGGWAHLDLLFGEETSDNTRRLFTAFVEEHLRKEGVTVREVLEMDCRGCGYRFPEALVLEYIAEGLSEIRCNRPKCDMVNRISDGAVKARAAAGSSVTSELIALRRTVEEKKQRDAEDAKREAKPVSIFVSYSHSDEPLREVLDKHLASLRREGMIQAWHDRKILPGSEWAKEIDRNVLSAKVILLLISSDFIASDYCVGIEMTKALERHAAGQARVIPVILRPVDWQGMPFASLQALPRDGKAVTRWNNQDEAFESVARGLRQVIADLLQPQTVAPRPASFETGSVLMPVVEPTPFRVLHLSDLHLGKPADPAVFLQPLIRDVKDPQDGLGFEALDYLVVSGDLTNYGSAEEFERVHRFLSGLMSRFEMPASRCIIVPGNHDLSWDTEGVYDWRPERKVAASELKEGRYVREGKLCGIRDDAIYPKRFENFARFYHQLTQQPYPLDPALQCVPFLFEEPRIQFLAANSAWEIDEYFPDRSGINQSALAAGLSRASEQIQIARKEGRIGKEDSVLRIAVWHHPVTGNEKIVQDAFMGQLRQEDFKLCLHGHVHEDRADLVGYLHPRKIHVAGAGSFGAPVRERPESTPRLYNLIEVARDHSRIRIHTRCLRKDGGAWEGWAVWPGDKSTERKTYYEIGLTQRR